MFSDTTQFSLQVCQFCVSSCVCDIVVSAGKLWDFLSALHSSLCERRLEWTVLRPALFPVKTAQFTQFSVSYDVTQ